MNSNTRYDEFQFSSSDGLLLHARKYGWANDDPYPVICLPSLTGSSVEFDPLAQFLASADGGMRRVLAVSARGRGLSDRDHNKKNYNLMTEASDVLTCITAAGLQDVNVIGTAHGGLTALLLTAQRPGILKSVILNEAAPKIEGQELVRQKQFLIRQKKVGDRDGAIAFLKSFGEPFFPALTDQDWADEVDVRYREENGKLVPDFDPAILNSLKNINLDVPLGEMWPEFGGLKNIPTMAICGQHSDMISAETLKRMQDIKADLEITIAEGQGHSPHLHLGNLPSMISAFLQ